MKKCPSFTLTPLLNNHLSPDYRLYTCQNELRRAFRVKRESSHPISASVNGSSIENNNNNSNNDDDDDDDDNDNNNNDDNTFV